MYSWRASLNATQSNRLLKHGSQEATVKIHFQFSFLKIKCSFVFWLHSLFWCVCVSVEYLWIVQKTGKISTSTKIDRYCWKCFSKSVMTVPYSLYRAWCSKTDAANVSVSTIQCNHTSENGKITLIFTVDNSDPFIEAANTKCNPIKLPMTVAKMDGYSLYNFSVSRQPSLVHFASYSFAFFFFIIFSLSCTF